MIVFLTKFGRSIFWNCLTFILFISAGCKSRNVDSHVSSIDATGSMSVRIRNSVSPQYVVRSHMIFKFYCSGSEKIPDCEEYDVMRMESFLRVMGVNENEITEYNEYLKLKKSHDESQKKLIELELAYKSAIEKKGNVSSLQKLEYQRMKKIYAAEINKFANVSAIENTYIRMRNRINNLSKLEQFFEPEVGDVISYNDITCSLSVVGALRCWGDPTSGAISGWKEIVQSRQLLLPAWKLNDLHGLFCVVGADGGVGCWGPNDKVVEGMHEAFANGEIKKPVQFMTGQQHNRGGMIDSFGNVIFLGQDRKKQAIAMKNHIERKDLKVPIRQIVIGVEHSCALDAYGAIACWGENADEKVTGLHVLLKSGVLKKPFVSLSGGYNHSCAVDSRGNAGCWGSDSLEQINGLKNAISEGKIKKPIRKIFSKGDKGCAIDQREMIACWGYAHESITAGLKRIIGEKKLQMPIMKIVPETTGCAIDAKRRLACWGDDRLAVTGRNDAGYKVGEFGPEDFATDLTQLGFYEE